MKCKYLVNVIVPADNNQGLTFLKELGMDASIPFVPTKGYQIDFGDYDFECVDYTFWKTKENKLYIWIDDVEAETNEYAAKLVEWFLGLGFCERSE